MHKYFPHQFYDNCQLTFALFKDVRNAKELRQSVMKGDFEATLLKPCMIFSPFQVLVAANEAVHHQQQKKLTTKNVHSEVLFCLSPTKNILESFKKFGMGDKDEAVFVVIVNDEKDKVLEDVKSRIMGTEVPVEECEDMATLDLIKKTYNVTDIELSSCSLDDALVSRIASKKFGT